MANDHLNQSWEASSDRPDGIAPRHFERGGEWLRGIVPISLLGAVLLAALLGLFGGGRDSTSSVAESGARLSITAPRTLRNGMFFEIVIIADARRAIAKPVIAISGSYLFDLTINSSIPQASEESFKGGNVAMTYQALQPGERLQVKLDGQVNPTLVGVNRGKIVLRDGSTELASQQVSLKVFP